MPAFIPGLQLSEAFYREAVRPILDAHCPALRYSAALIGSGSEVLGYDTPQSTDHHWGPRVLLFLGDAEHEELQPGISQTLSERLPYTFRGYSTNFGAPDSIGVRLMTEIASGPVAHRVEIHALGQYFLQRLGRDPRGGLGPLDWLTMPEQRLLEATSGAVFHDDLYALTEIRRTLAYYPDDVWRYLLASQWQRISQEEAFVGRTGDVGDELGSQIVAARLVREMIRLCFLMERRYAPYSKWFGTAFSRLRCADALAPHLTSALQSPSWQERERHLSAAYEIVARMHNALGITAPIETTVSPYHDRPYRVIHADRFAAALRKTIASDEIRGISALIGAVDQFVDSTDVLSHPHLCRRLQRLYE